MLVYITTTVLSYVSILIVYYFQSRYVSGISFWSIALIAPSLLAIIFGAAIGTIINQYFENEKNRDLKQSLEEQKVLNQILIESKETHELLKFLEKVLEIITAAPITKTKPEAGILLKGQDGKYRIASCINFKSELLKCAIEGVECGECLCGLVAEKQEYIFAGSDDKRHTVQYEEMEDHGHYVLPIIQKKTTLGVLAFHTEIDHKFNKQELEFLKSVADILALVINTYLSEQKERESQLVISSARRIAGLASWQILLPSRQTYWSEEIYIMLGYKPGEVKLDVQSLSTMVHQDDREKLKEALAKAEVGYPFEFEVRMIAKNGRPVYVINKCTPHQGVDGKINKLSGTVFNITEIREKQEAIIKQEAFIESIASDAPYAMYLLDVENNKVLFTNREFNKNVDNEILMEFENKGIEVLERFYHPEDLVLYKDICQEVLKADKDYYHIIARQAYDGKNYMWINQRIKPFAKNERGEVTQLLFVSINLDKQKKAEEQTRELNQQLITQNTKLKKMNNELDRFIYSVSHDIRAPLASIIGLVHLYKTDNDSRVKDLYVEHIGTSIFKLEEFIHEVVDFTRNSKTQLTPVKIKILDYLKGLYSQLEYIDPTNKISFEVDSNGIEEIITDQDRLGIILRNILSNAIKYSSRSVDSFIRCEIEQVDSKNIIRIKDNGIGIEDSQLDKVFDMFHRASELSQGSGLGLYIAKETAERLGGKLKIWSKFREGTELTIELPIAVA